MSKSQTLSDRIRQIVRDALHDEFDDIMRPDAEDIIADAGGAIRRHELDNSRTGSATRTRKHPSRRRRTARLRRVEYHLLPRRKNAKEPELPPAYNRIWKWLQKNAPATAKDVEKGTNAPIKTVESAIYRLRHLRLIESREIDNE